MTRKSVIYLSAPTRDLDSTRQLVTKVLKARGCQVTGPDSLSGTSSRQAEHIHDLIAGCDLVLQIIGYRDTPFLPAPLPSQEMVYLHVLEARYAQELGKPVHPIFLTDEYPTEPVEVENDPELSERHRYWRTLLRSDLILYIPANEAELMAHIQRLHLGPFYPNAAGGSNVKPHPPVTLRS